MNAAALIERFSKLPASARVAALAVAIGAVLFAAVAGSLARDTRTALFAAPLHPEQLSEVQERLAEWNVPFVMGADNVSVEAKRRNEVLLRLSLAGVPHAHVDTSDEMLAKVSALTPQSVIDAQTRGGLAADLELALRGIDGVQDASVIIAPSSPAVFADQQSHDASASVRLRVRPGARLTPNAIAGIRSFVAAGVAGLDERHVTIVDDRGVALGTDSLQAADPSELQASLQGALDAAFGAGISIVRVHVEYDSRSQQIREVRRGALASAPISSERSDEQYSGADKRYSKSTHTDDRGSDTREVDTSVAGGRVARISVAIAVDESRGADLYKIRMLAAAAAGLDARRGDTIAVQAVQFHSAPVARKEAWYAAYGALVAILPPLAAGAIFLFGLKLCSRPALEIARSLAARASVTQTRKAVSGFAPAQVRGALQHEPPHTAAAVISALPAATAAAVLDLYPPEERSAIIRRMARPQSPLLPDYETLIANA